MVIWTSVRIIMTTRMYSGADGRTHRQRAVQEEGLVFKRIDDETGFEVIDTIDRHRYALQTGNQVAPELSDTGPFLFPIDAAVTVTTDAITLPTVVPVCIRDDEGTLLVEAEHFAQETLPQGIYELDLSAPVQLYLRVESPVTVTSDVTQTRISFDTETDVLVGARSRHEHPAATVTTTDDPVDMMAAVSTFGSALKTTSPERSFPMFRGHPPSIERGDELSIPPSMTPPDTSLRLEAPPEYRSVYVAAPLVYYLGAELCPGETPRMVGDTGFEYTLDAACGFECEVERVLKQVFFLDCVTRTEGIYPVELHERQAVESQLDLDFATLYALPLAERIEAYLSIPFITVEEHLPEWKLTTHIEPIPSSVEMLPFVTKDLAVIRTPRSEEVSAKQAAVVDEQSRMVDNFLRNDGADFVRGTAAGNSSDATCVQPETTDSLEQIWIGAGTRQGANKAMIEAYQNRLNRVPTNGDIDITVVYNDISHPDNDAATSNSEKAMGEERAVVDDVYGSRAQLPFDVTVHENPTVDELRAVLSSPTDFLHYIGHVDEQGFECVDGKFDTGTLETAGADVFLLNACQSYQQGMHLVKAGSIGGIVTLSDVVNSGAIRIGRALARLLNGGFPLRAALEIASDESLSGVKYTVVGDGGVAIAQAEGGTPNLCEITATAESYRLEYKTYPTAQLGMGSMRIPYVENNEEFFLNSGSLKAFEMSKKELHRFLELENVPVRVDGELYWSRHITADDI